MTNGSAVVTRATQGIGLVGATQMIADGYSVFEVDFLDADLAAAASSLSGGPGSTIVADAALRRTHEHASNPAEEPGGLAGGVMKASCNLLRSIHEVDQKTDDRGISAVVGGVFWGTAVAVWRMLTTGSGSLASMPSRRSLVTVPSFPVCAAAKGATNARRLRVAGEYASRGIHCRAVAQSLIETLLAYRALERAPDQGAQIDSWYAPRPIGRGGHVEDVAACPELPLSVPASCSTGQVLVADGGATVRARDSE